MRQAYGFHPNVDVPSCTPMTSLETVTHRSTLRGVATLEAAQVIVNGDAVTLMVTRQVLA